MPGKPAAIVTFLDGVWIRRPTAAHCAALGEALARLHLAGADFPMRRDNALSVAGWRQLYEGCRERAHKVERNLETLVAAELDVLERDWPRGLPQGVIHADLFPDNVFFLGDKLSGLIDFYFACTDTLMYDVAICLNAWCFETDHSYNVTKGRALLAQLRQDASAVGRGMGQAAAVGARRRLALSAHPAGRLARRAARRAGAAEGPARIRAQAPLPPEGQERARLRSERAVTAESPQKLSHVVIHTDGACSGNPGPGGWGAILTFGDREKELKGGEANTTNNRMELMAAISALEALKRPCRVDLHTDSQYLRNGIMSYIAKWKRNGWRTADKKPVKNIDLWKRLDAALGAHQIHWHWVKGHSGHDMNERADELAREAIAEIRAQRP